VPPGDAQRAANELHAFLSDPDKCERAALAARELAIHRFDRDVLAREYLELLVKTVAAHRAEVSVRKGGALPPWKAAVGSSGGNARLMQLLHL